MTTATTIIDTFVRHTDGITRIYITVSIRFRKIDNWGMAAYAVERADSGQVLGMVYPPMHGKAWTAYTENAAYYPAGTPIVERSVTHPKHRGDGIKMELQGTGFRTRADAASDGIVDVLASRRAAAFADLVEASTSVRAW